MVSQFSVVLIGGDGCCGLALSVGWGWIISFENTASSEISRAHTALSMERTAVNMTKQSSRGAYKVAPF